VRARLVDVPSNAFVDPELQRDIAGCVNDALAGMVRLGTLRAGTGGYALTGHHVDPRFPHIADMIAYQSTMLAETLACARRLAEPDTIAVSVTAQR
jgi:hypothetical protein